jgi:hypothetical protein|tara:strand:+ start:5868 stop:7439 length:1572 start_codon:yes stop_codon:yes gene_type:complete
MSIERTIKLEADVKDAIKQIDELKKGVQETNTSASESKSSFKKMKTGVSAVGVAFKAMGIGLIVSAFVKLKDMLGQNQVVMDKLSVASEALGFIFQKIVDVSVKFSEKVTEAFSDPKQAIQDLWTSLKENIVNRIEGLIDLFGSLGKVIKGVFTADMDLLKEGASEAGVAFIQLNTGLDEVQQSKAADNITKIWKETKKATKEATAYAKAITQMRNEVKLAEAEQRGLQLAYQKEAELQRQIRDDISLTFEERIAANEELGRVLDEQFAEEQALAQKKIDLAQMELDQNKDNIDLQVALINAKTEMTDLDERITGQRSEQLTNLNALEKEKTDAELTRIKEVADAKKKAIDDQEKADAKLAEAQKKADAEDLKNAELLAKNKEMLTRKAVSDVIAILGEESKAAKAIQVGMAIRDTYLGATKALAQGGIFGALSAGGIIALGLANVKKIIATGDEGGGSISDTSSGGIPEATSPAGVGDMLPNMEAIAPPTLGDQAPVQAYVVENDISNAQALQEELNIQATL